MRLHQIIVVQILLDFFAGFLTGRMADKFVSIGFYFSECRITEPAFNLFENVFLGEVTFLPPISIFGSNT